MKNKIGFGLRVISLLFYFIVITPHFKDWSAVPFMVIIIFVLILINLSQLFNPISIKKNVLIYICMICYFLLIHLWSIDYGLKKEFDFKGQKLSYEHTPFNGSYYKIFGDQRYDYVIRTNQQRKKMAIGSFLYLQCNYYENEQYYSAAQLEAIENGTMKILYSDRYKGNLKNLIVQSVKEDKVYYNNYKDYTKQSEVVIDSVIKYRTGTFGINTEE